MTFVSLHTEEDKEGITEREPPISKKRIANKIDSLFMMLFEDLNLLIEWENEEKKKLEDGKPNAFSYSGIVWVHWGMLAERLNRKRLAEKAYRNAIEKGFSLFTWCRLLNIYQETFNSKACLVCMAEIFD